MALDRWVAILFLVISLIYGYAAFNYPLLPFERNMSFLPNTLPMALSALGVIVALVIIFSPKAAEDADGLGDIDLAQVRQFKIGQALGLVGAMVLYALLLRPIGFLAATALFIAGTGIVLGEAGVMLRGPSGAGKSLLALLLLSTSSHLPHICVNPDMHQNSKESPDH